MTYEEFQAYCVTHLWKMGDTFVIENLPQIIMTAEHELNRIFKVENRVTVTDIVAEAQSWPLPADYRSMRHVSSPLRGEMIYNVPADFSDKRAHRACTIRDYTVVNRTIRLLGNINSENPLPLEIWYYRNLIPFAQDTDGSDNWLVDEYFDVYLYCVLKHTAPFLREDERLATWGALFNSAFTTAIEENDERKYAGSPLQLKMPRGIR